MPESKPTVRVSSTGVASIRPAEILRSEAGKRIVARTAEVLKKAREQQQNKDQQ